MKKYTTQVKIKNTWKWLYLCLKKDTSSPNIKRLLYCHYNENGVTHQEDMSVVNMLKPNIGALAYIKQIPTNLETMDKNIIIIEEFNSPLSEMDRSFRLKTNKENLSLNQMDLKDVYTTFHITGT